MIEVRMRVDDEADRLVRDRLLGGRHHCQAARVALAALDDQDVIAHVDGERRVVATDLERAFAKLLDRRRCRGRGGPPGAPPGPPPRRQEAAVA